MKTAPAHRRIQASAYFGTDRQFTNLNDVENRWIAGIMVPNYPDLNEKPTFGTEENHMSEIAEMILLKETEANSLKMPSVVASDNYSLRFSYLHSLLEQRILLPAAKVRSD